MTTGAEVPILGHTIHRLGEVVSTQIEAARLAAEGASEGTVVTATHQSAGRGRRGRPWLDARWPNDVMVGKRKICGLLPEAVTTRGGALEHMILGIGLNVDQADFPAPIRELATSMRIETGGERVVDEMLASVLAALEDRYRRFVQAGLGSLLPAWLERAQGIGGRVTAADGREGIAVGLDLDGALLLRTDSGETMRVVAGEVTMEAVHAAGH